MSAAADDTFTARCIPCGEGCKKSSVLAHGVRTGQEAKGEPQRQITLVTIHPIDSCHGKLRVVRDANGGRHFRVPCLWRRVHLHSCNARASAGYIHR